MNTDEKIAKLREELKALSASKYKRFNVLLIKEAKEKLDKLAKEGGKSKAKTLSEIIIKYKK